MPLTSFIALTLALQGQATLPTTDPGQIPEITRDTYGVPHIAAPNWEQAFFDDGYAVAQDRLWQMEVSRRLAQGQMAEVFGSRYVNSDTEVLHFAYTEDELQKQLDGLSPRVRSAMQSYTAGVNAYIKEATAAKKLPKGYSDAGFEPRPWTEMDSEAVAIRLYQLFGRGGAGQLRNWAVLQYLSGQPHAKAHYLDIFNDLSWQVDTRAIPTLPPSEDPQRDNPPLKVSFSQKDTENQLAALPKLSILDLLPVIQLAEKSESKVVAENEHVPFRTGSYCTVVGPERSALGFPILMNGPQMGFSTPSIVHEISIDTPDMRIAGMDVPGVPGVVIGITPVFAWGLTSGVADTQDIYAFKGEGDGSYHYGSQVKPTETVHFTIKVKGAADKTVDQVRTMFGPVLLHSHDWFFAQRSAYEGVEMKSLEAQFGLYSAKTADDVEKAISVSTMNFNFFYAMNTGDFGWRYLGKVPNRATGFDPRIPIIASPATDWKGFLTLDQMPHMRNPHAGIIANWNNKPTEWWPNYDTPTWGRIFHNETLLDQLKKPKLDSEDVEAAAYNIARFDETAKYFMPYAASIHAPKGLANGEAAEKYLKAFDGRLLNGSIAAEIYLYWKASLRAAIFQGTTGDFGTGNIFNLVAQPTVMLNALQKRTKTNFLGARSAAEVAQETFEDAVKEITHARGKDVAKWGLAINGINVPGQAPIPYSNRGSYIQIVELMGLPHGRNVMPPGEAEEGEHQLDQVNLARAFTYKLFELWRP
ncbi:MAG TPA: penicillin acylase family protein [Fimbriimonadaceae bacterium]|jgi:penicillin amidase